MAGFLRIFRLLFTSCLFAMVAAISAKEAINDFHHGREAADTAQSFQASVKTLAQQRIEQTSIDVNDDTSHLSVGSVSDSKDSSYSPDLGPYKSRSSYLDVRTSERTSGVDQGRPILRTNAHAHQGPRPLDGQAAYDPVRDSQLTDYTDSQFQTQRHTLTDDTYESQDKTHVVSEFGRGRVDTRTTGPFGSGDKKRFQTDDLSTDSRFDPHLSGQFASRDGFYEEQRSYQDQEEDPRGPNAPLDTQKFDHSNSGFRQEIGTVLTQSKITSENQETSKVRVTGLNEGNFFTPKQSPDLVVTGQRDRFSSSSEGSDHIQEHHHHQHHHHSDDPIEWLRDAIQGNPGNDYPILGVVPPTSFQCSQQQFPAGIYGDEEARCQVFHICQSDGRHDSFLCPNGTIFNQQYFVCDWWYNYNCSDTQYYYALNSEIYSHVDKGMDSNIMREIRNGSYNRDHASSHFSQTHGRAEGHERPFDSRKDAFVSSAQQRGGQGTTAQHFGPVVANQMGNQNHGSYNEDKIHGAGQNRLPNHGASFRQDKNSFLRQSSIDTEVSKTDEYSPRDPLYYEQGQVKVDNFNKDTTSQEKHDSFSNISQQESLREHGTGHQHAERSQGKQVQSEGGANLDGYHGYVQEEIQDDSFQVDQHRVSSSVRNIDTPLVSSVHYDDDQHQTSGYRGTENGIRDQTQQSVLQDNISPNLDDLKGQTYVTGTNSGNYHTLTQQELGNDSSQPIQPKGPWVVQKESPQSTFTITDGKIDSFDQQQQQNKAFLNEDHTYSTTDDKIEQIQEEISLKNSDDLSSNFHRAQTEVVPDHFPINDNRNQDALAEHGMQHTLEDKSGSVFQTSQHRSEFLSEEYGDVKFDHTEDFSGGNPRDVTYTPSDYRPQAQEFTDRTSKGTSKHREGNIHSFLHSAVGSNGGDDLQQTILEVNSKPNSLRNQEKGNVDLQSFEQDARTGERAATQQTIHDINFEPNPTGIQAESNIGLYTPNGQGEARISQGKLLGGYLEQNPIISQGQSDADLSVSDDRYTGIPNRGNIQQQAIDKNFDSNPVRNEGSTELDIYGSQNAGGITQQTVHHADSNQKRDQGYGDADFSFSEYTGRQIAGGTTQEKNTHGRTNLLSENRTINVLNQPIQGTFSVHQTRNGVFQGNTVNPNAQHEGHFYQQGSNDNSYVQQSIVQEPDFKSEAASLSCATEHEHNFYDYDETKLNVPASLEQLREESQSQLVKNREETPNIESTRGFVVEVKPKISKQYTNDYTFETNLKNTNILAKQKLENGGFNQNPSGFTGPTDGDEPHESAARIIPEEHRVLLTRGEISSQHHNTYPQLQFENAHYTSQGQRLRFVSPSVPQRPSIQQIEQDDTSIPSRLGTHQSSSRDPIIPETNPFQFFQKEMGNVPLPGNQPALQSQSVSSESLSDLLLRTKPLIQEKSNDDSGRKEHILQSFGNDKGKSPDCINFGSITQDAKYSHQVFSEPNFPQYSQEVENSRLPIQDVSAGIILRSRIVVSSDQQKHNENLQISSQRQDQDFTSDALSLRENHHNEKDVHRDHAQQRYSVTVLESKDHRAVADHASVKKSDNVLHDTQLIRGLSDRSRNVASLQSRHHTALDTMNAQPVIHADYTNESRQGSDHFNKQNIYAPNHATGLGGMMFLLQKKYEPIAEDPMKLANANKGQYDPERGSHQHTYDRPERKSNRDVVLRKYGFRNLTTASFLMPVWKETRGWTPLILRRENA